MKLLGGVLALCLCLMACQSHPSIESTRISSLPKDEIQITDIAAACLKHRLGRSNDDGKTLVYLTIEKDNAESVVRRTGLPQLAKSVVAPRKSVRTEEGIIDVQTKFRVIRYELKLNSLEMNPPVPTATMQLTTDWGTPLGWAQSELKLEFRNGEWRVVSEELIMAT